MQDYLGAASDAPKRFTTRKWFTRNPGSDPANREAVAAAFNAFLAREWFKRKWVIQEVAQTYGKSRSILIGDKVFDYDKLVNNLHLRDLLEATSPLEARPAQRTLLENLARYHKALSSDPHDHIYALVGISSDHIGLSIDYTIGAGRLYTHVAEHCIRKGNVVAVLALATVKKTMGDLTSWVPDWRNASDHHRSGMHADALNTLALRGQKLFEVDTMPTNGARVHFDLSRSLKLKAWIVSSCIGVELHSQNTCAKCILWGEGASPTQAPSTARPQFKSKGKAPVVASMPSSTPHSLLSMRRETSQAKWGGKIREQFDEVMHADEVLCLQENSPFGFVLSPSRLNGDLRTIVLRYCFQVDEEGWASNWFVSVLGEERQEWISLV